MSLILSGTTGISDIDGSAATPAIRGTDANTGIFFPAADTIAFAEGGVESARFDASGNFGLGVTPSAWTNAVAFQFGNKSSLYQLGTTLTALGNNTANGNYASTGFAGAYVQSSSSGAHQWFTAPSGTAGNAISFTQAMTLDASGNLALGRTAATTRLHIKSASDNADVLQIQDASEAQQMYMGVSAANGGPYVFVATNQALRFGTNNTERARIDSGGNLLVGTANSSLSVGVGCKFLAGGAVGVNLNSPSENSYHLHNINAVNTGFRFYVNVNGGVNNFSGNNVNLSDERTKTNIELAGGYLEKICAIPVKLFNYKDEAEGEQRTLGVIAQDVEAVAPEFVNNDGWEGTNPEDGVPLKTIYTTDMMFGLMKAIQEQQALIQTLTARVEALDARLISLEGAQQ